MEPRNLRGWELWSPDEIAETTIGLTSAMCRRLWASLKEMPSPMSSFECDEPAAYMESRELRNVWDFFTPEEQHALNVHAAIYEGNCFDPTCFMFESCSSLEDDAKAFSESWECGTGEAKRLVVILALIEAGLMTADATAEELEDRHLTLETFADLKQFLGQWELKLERDRKRWEEEEQDLAEWLAGQAKA